MGRDDAIDGARHGVLVGHVNGMGRMPLRRGKRVTQRGDGAFVEVGQRHARTEAGQHGDGGKTNAVARASADDEDGLAVKFRQIQNNLLREATPRPEGSGPVPVRFIGPDTTYFAAP